MLLKVELPFIHFIKDPKRRSLFYFRCAHFSGKYSYFFLSLLFFSWSQRPWPDLPVSLNSAGLMYMATRECRPDQTFFIDRLWSLFIARGSPEPPQQLWEQGWPDPWSPQWVDLTYAPSHSLMWANLAIIPSVTALKVQLKSINWNMPWLMCDLISTEIWRQGLTCWVAPPPLKKKTSIFVLLWLYHSFYWAKVRLTHD